jgi:prepilin-type N-terminal cleavage/methylation domain-containing protein
MQEKGFSIVELLISVTIIAIIAAMALPAFKNFSNSQVLKSITQQIKTDARSTHNKALNGILNRGGERSAWILRISNDQSLYEMAACPTANSFGSCKDYLHNYNQVSTNSTFKFYACDYPCTSLTTYTGVTLYYAPIDGTVIFYPYDRSVGSTYESQPFGTSPNTALTISKISVLIKSSDTTQTSIFTINSKGDLTENSH